MEGGGGGGRVGEGVKVEKVEGVLSMPMLWP